MNVEPRLRPGHEQYPWRFFFGYLAAAILFRYLCHSLMLIPVLFNELRPAPTVPDLVLALVPRLDWLAHINYYLWIACYFPPALYLLYRDRKLFARFIILDGIISLSRGLMIPLTGLGPPHGSDLNALRPFSLWTTWWQLVNPYRALIGDTAGVYLTKDMFFSGHIATTFLLYLFARRLGKIESRVFLVLQIFSLLVVFFSHLHYTIDVIGAYAITFTVFTLGNRWLCRNFPSFNCRGF
ncbi:MAG: sphingomyelin synthase family protein [Candidatus Aminicenantes bacterium]|nr:sphingomyelin synthase family protein [Acidobacteriota bacterium]MCG2811978.1 sphingomyelin synthase family protein [Candidatus Aminicenantes bacterium]